MSTRCSAIILATILLTHVSPGAESYDAEVRYHPQVRKTDSYDVRLQSIGDELTRCRQGVLAAAIYVDAGLRAHGIQSPSISPATNALQKMMQDSAAWRDLASRSTRTQQQAETRLSHYIQEANASLNDARRQLALVKKAEYEAWARGHPEAAKIKELEERTRAAENAADDAQSRSLNAQREANIAAEQMRSQVNNARVEADEANRRSRDALMK